MSQESLPPTAQPKKDADTTRSTSGADFEPSDAMRQRNRRVGFIFLGIIAFLVVLTVITRIILSS